ncbi:MAG: nuclear transport factor 2 family protein, partial [Coriobacteriales bacterium]|nr:nuclear transport factor 2 family protein [Coriobacteriales bacterium]
GDAYDELTALNANRWEKVDGSWRIAEFRWDVMIAPKHQHEGMYLEKDDLRYYPGIHLPVVSGELDNPWRNVTTESEVKPDEEQTCECVCKYAFGIDTLCFSLVDEAVSPCIIVNMAPWGAMDKREFMQTLKYNRQPNRYWAHPVQVESVEVEGNRAFVKAYRMAGHKQKIMTAPEGIEDVYADARYEFTLERAEAGWQIVRLDYLLGILPWERNDNAIEVGRVGQDAL